MKRVRITNLAIVSCLMTLASCIEKQTASDAIQPATAVLSTSDVELTERFPASIQGRQDIEIYPQVSGTISRVCVKEGDNVRKGQVLFIIDQVPYQAALRTAKARVQTSEANLKTANLELDSKRELYKEGVVSDYDLTAAENAMTVAKAALAEAQANEINAANSLSYTEVKSPANGVIGTIPYRVGALVSPTMAQSLTTVSDNNEMFVYFSMSESQLRSLVKEYKTPQSTIENMPGVQLELNDGTVYDSLGKIETISGIINPKTGTASIRCVFPNNDRLLWSGGIGNIIIPRREKNVIVIPQTATYELQDRTFAYKVTNGKLESSQIKVLPLGDGKDYIVTSGLVVGDTIVTEGVGLLKDGMEIKTK